MRNSKRRSKSEGPDEEKKGVYGFVLNARGLARGAILLKDYPASLRVLVLVAEYMNQEGECRISQDTVAARLGITRQTVNRHLAILEEMGILYSGTEKEGVLKRYVLETEGLEEKRFGEPLVQQRREAKRAAKRRKFNRDAATPKPKQAPPEEAAPDLREPEPRPEAEPPATAHVNPDWAWMIGQEARTKNFGSGIIEGFDGGAALVRFPTGIKKIPSCDFSIFVRPPRATHEPASPGPEPTPSETPKPKPWWT